MDKFTFEDDVFYCNNEKENEIHNVKLLITGITTIQYDCEDYHLTDEKIIDQSRNLIALKCLTCGESEDITDRVKIEADEYYGEFIKFKD